MVIGFVETGEVQIYSDLDEAMNDWGRFPTDILSDVVLFYELDGKFYQPLPIYAQRKWYQRSAKVDHLEFRLCDPEDAHKDKIGYLLHYEARELQENPHIVSLDALKKLVPLER